MPKKRFSAFEDFPVEPGPAAAGEPRKASSLFDKAGGEAHVLHQPQAPQVERIERLPPSQMLPDRFQPRRLLPTAVRKPFYAGQIDCYQAARQWLQMARGDAAIKAQVDRLLAMGSSFEEHGQIKPITGAWVETGGGNYRFQIETGERRFWAACLQYITARATEEPLLRVEVVAQPTRSRQVLENRHAEEPSAVGRACEVAALILAELEIHPDPAAPDEFDYFRQAIGRRMPPGLWDKIIPIMQVSRVQLENLLKILKQPARPAARPGRPPPPARARPARGPAHAGRGMGAAPAGQHQAKADLRPGGRADRRRRRRAGARQEPPQPRQPARPGPAVAQRAAALQQRHG